MPYKSTIQSIDPEAKSDTTTPCRASRWSETGPRRYSINVGIIFVPIVLSAPLAGRDEMRAKDHTSTHSYLGRSPLSRIYYISA